MQFSEILGQEHIKSSDKSAGLGRIPHAQLFVGPEGSGTLAMAIAYIAILCSNQDGKIQVQYRLQFKISKAIASRFTFCYPTVTTEEVKKAKKSIDFIVDWRNFVSKSLWRLV
jgi:DNA polymerase-3 subunit delta'